MGTCPPLARAPPRKAHVSPAYSQESPPIPRCSVLLGTRARTTPTAHTHPRPRPRGPDSPPAPPGAPRWSHRAGSARSPASVSASAQAPPLTPQTANEFRGPGRPRPTPGNPGRRLADPGAVYPHVGRGWGERSGSETPPPPPRPRLPPRPAPRGAQSSTRRPPPRTPVSGSPRAGTPRWPSAARCTSASWRGRTCPPRTCERGQGWEPQLSGEGHCPPGRLTFPGSTHK